MQTNEDVSPFDEEGKLEVFESGCKSQFRQFRHEICERRPDLETIVVENMHGQPVVVAGQKAQNDLWSVLAQGYNGHCEWV